MIKDERAQAISLDFVTAIVLFMIALTFVYSTLPDIVTSYTGESAKMHPTVDRLSEMLVKDKTTGLTNNTPNVLNRTMLDLVMLNFTETGNKTWWEFGNGINNGTKTITSNDYESTLETMGLKVYNCYMQVRPIDEDSFDIIEANNNIDSNVIISGDLVMIERIAFMENRYYKLMIWVW